MYAENYAALDVITCGIVKFFDVCLINESATNT